MSIIGDGILLGAGGESASIFVTGLSETDTVTATKDGTSIVGKWTQKPNPAYVTLPDGYTELEYIESTGTQYIDTGVVPSEVGYKAEVGFCATSVPSSGESWILATYQSSSANWRCGFSNGSFHTSGGFSYSQTSSTTADTVADGTNTMTPALSLYLFSQHEASGAVHTGNSKYKLYYCNISNGGTAIRKFIPAKRNSDSVIGLYDLVSNTFFTNAGTGTFTAGPEVPQTINGFLIDKIKSYGTWTITATDGTKTATHDVLVDSADMFSVSINYSPSNALYWNGDPCENITGGWTNDDYTFTTWGSSYTRFQVTQTDEYMDSSATSGYTLAGTFNAIDLTNYSKVMWEIDNVTGIAGGGYPPTWRLCASPAKSFSTSTETVTEVQVTETGTHTYSIDVSSLSGLFFISFTNNSIAYSGRQLVGHILRVWLE